MTQKDKELLLKDLCARLPYGVKGKTLGSKTCTLSFIGNDGSITADTYHCWLSSKQFVPYLRPISSMTEEEQKELEKIIDGILGYKARNYFHSEDDYKWDTLYEAIDWLNAHHFDYRGLIPMGLVLEAPEGMYN